jgi:hypothetical protein
MTKLPEPLPFMSFRGEHVYTEAQMLQFRRDALEEALQCYSQEDTASDYIGKILDLKDET